MHFRLAASYKFTIQVPAESNVPNACCIDIMDPINGHSAAHSIFELTISPYVLTASVCRTVPELHAWSLLSPQGAPQ